MLNSLEYAPPKVQKISDEYSFAVNSSKKSTKCFSKFQHYPVKSASNPVAKKSFIFRNQNNNKNVKKIPSTRFETGMP